MWNIIISLIFYSIILPTWHTGPEQPAEHQAQRERALEQREVQIDPFFAKIY